MSKLIYVVHKMAERTHSGQKWHLYNVHPDGHRTSIGFHAKRKAATVVARLLAGPGGKVEVVNKPYTGDAWRIPA